ncbi:D-alanyl-D-alanine carboxypeptidase/D-alanyl-D-alanine endopeptidase [Williamsia deligens]|uniref:D-alanyl-D-alanine carboxypeptidase/D-alanyl-D-alanine-endopeptidase n=1 Tax=Williamsia deligens TaxID=321325 RepID=A0ABW3G408_9NOCA|nr:D-alanyl-D-alanine carboxypeptidase/D-alanyl-D-alanine-endopeptidase [Williamsia deligens]MCP2194301.1 D-alanyl-D-alanine carboxypeptidase / D-alanyl-D-alanine-endopeptidase (penicillin-binding protein 4) [Williamsia deligens]
MNARARRRVSVWWTVIPVLVLLVVAAVVAVVAVTVDSGGTQPAANAPARPAAASADPAVVPVASAAPEPTSAGVSAQLASVARDPRLGTLTGEISDALTGQVLWSQNPTRPMTPASTTKILTAAAVLLSVPLDATLTTSVVDAGNGRIVVVGAGDPTLSVQPDGTDTFFTDAPRIADLAAQIRRSGVQVSSVAVDTGRFTGPSFASGWETADIAGGSIAPIEALMADSARTDPTALYSPRTATPAVTAATDLARDLGVSADAVSSGTAPQGARVIASVTSAPMQTRLRDMLVDSDDVLAETMAIEVARARGLPASLSGATDAVAAVLREAGVDMSQVTLQDTNGLSTGDRIPAGVLDAILRAASGTQDTKLRPLLDMLPIAGATGTLSDRFSSVSGVANAAGWVKAKTGTLTGVSGLAGIVQTRQNRVLTFALLSNGTNPADARPALDAIAVRLRGCGCR